MINPKEAIENAPINQYYGHKTPWYFRLSYKIERGFEKLAWFMEQQRRLHVRHIMKEMWKVGDRVITHHGKGVVIKNVYLYNTHGMGGWIQTDVRYDGAPIDATSYPDVGHYNQVFLEKE